LTLSLSRSTKNTLQGPTLFQRNAAFISSKSPTQRFYLQHSRPSVRPSARHSTTTLPSMNHCETQRTAMCYIDIQLTVYHSYCHSLPPAITSHTNNLTAYLSTVMRRITTFRSTTDRIYDCGPIML
jgi:hypothetical protein